MLNIEFDLHKSEEFCPLSKFSTFEMRSDKCNISKELVKLIDVNSLDYRGEGNNNIVLANNKGFIYRVRKESYVHALLNKKTGAYKKSSHQTVLFGQHRMTQFFGNEFLPSSFLIDVDSSFLQEIDKHFLSQRPEFRLNRKVDVMSHRILAAPDATRLPNHLADYGEGPTICVEIKPKFGAILQGVERDELDRAKMRNALFCMMQFHETKIRMWGEPSSYCPCDLFSGNRQRMVIALRAMYAVPQNNFRVFLDSERVRNNHINRLDEALPTFFYGTYNTKCITSSSSFRSVENSSRDSDDGTPYLDTCTSSESLNDLFSQESVNKCSLHASPLCSFDLPDVFLECLILEALLLDFSGTGIPIERPETSVFRYDCQMHCQIGVDYDTVGQDLPHNSVLGRVFSAQLQSQLSHENIIQHYNRVQAFFVTNSINWNSFVSGIVAPETKMDDPLLMESLKLVEKHLVAMSARDCSLMLTFQRAKSTCPENVRTVGGQCPCLARTIVNVTVVDLDPKKLTNLDERVSMERDVISTFLQATEQPTS